MGGMSKPIFAKRQMLSASKTHKGAHGVGESFRH
jgi:hypothetical protein